MWGTLHRQIHKEMNETQMSPVLMDMNSSMIVNYCDYYEKNVGYQFT